MSGCYSVSRGQCLKIILWSYSSECSWPVRLQDSLLSNISRRDFWHVYEHQRIKKAHLVLLPGFSIFFDKYDLCEGPYGDLLSCLCKSQHFCSKVMAENIFGQYDLLNFLINIIPRRNPWTILIFGMLRDVKWRVKLSYLW